MERSTIGKRQSGFFSIAAGLAMLAVYSGLAAGIVAARSDDGAQIQTTQDQTTGPVTAREPIE